MIFPGKRSLLQLHAISLPGASQTNAGPVAPVGCWGQSGNEMAYARGGHVSTLLPASSFANSTVHSTAQALRGLGQQQQQADKLQEVGVALLRAEEYIQQGRCQEAVAIISSQVQASQALLMWTSLIGFLYV